MRGYLGLGLVVLAALGCNKGGGGGNGSSASTASTTTATTTSSTTTTTTTTPVTTTTTPIVNGKVNANLKIVSAVLDDSNADHIVSKGDTLTVRFSAPIMVVATAPAGEIQLLVAGDTFGTGATLAPVSTQTTDVNVVLGANPKIQVTGTFSTTGTGAYRPSGVDVAPTVKGIVDMKGLLPAAGVGVDVTSTTLVEGCFTLTSKLAFPRGLHSATLLDDGTVLIAGGITATGPGTSNYQRENELYDPVANTDATLSSSMTRKGQNGATFKVGRYAHTATKLANGKVLIAGGHGFEDLGTTGSPIYSELASCYLYDPATKTFTETGKLAKARRDHSAVLIAAGAKVLVFGGWDATTGSIGTSEIFDSATGTWSAGPNMVTGRYDDAVVATPTGVSVIGGATITASGTYTDVTADEVYDATTNKFAAATVSLSPEFHSHTATLLDSGDILATGGYGSGAIRTKCLMLSKLTGQWLPAGDLLKARERHVACRVQGDVLVSGGMYVDATGTVKTVDTVETVGPAGAIKSSALGFPRLSHTATVLADGRVLLIGGFANPTKDIRGMDGTSNAAIEIFVRP